MHSLLDSVRIAVAQTSVKTSDLTHNVEAVEETLRKAKREAVDLVVFPESVLTGYLFESREESMDNAISQAHPVLARLRNLCMELSIHAVIGFLESSDDWLYNSAELMGPEGQIGIYRKQHLPHLGADRFVDPGPGAATRVFDTSIGRIGLMICFDLRFPESARELGLEGADIIAMPTNWPLQSTILADHVVRVRALENLVYLAVADRCDSERGIPFLGRSQIISPRGEVLMDAQDQEGLFTTEVILSNSREKRLVFEPGVFELDVFGARRPENYSALTEPLALTTKD